MRDELAALVETIASGEAILFTGAGFSRGMHDRHGRPLPTSAEMAGELWRIVFDDEPQDDSSLADLFDVALRRDPAAVTRYLEERLRVGNGDAPPHVIAWLAAPWRRIYTLNVDDAEVAAMRHGRLPHRLRSVSALEPAAAAAVPGDDRRDGPVIDVVHLNGMVGRPLDRMTFSTLQYAERLCDRQPSYEQLVEDLVRAPFVFVGTTLDEVILWQHVMSRAAAAGDPPRPRSFLVTRSLTRARALLLDAFGITWLPRAAEAAASELFGARRH